MMWSRSPPFCCVPFDIYFNFLCRKKKQKWTY